MSTNRLTLRQSVALVWRTLRSMRTALILLLLLALASVAGSLIPQWPNSPERVAEYQLDHGLWGQFLDRAGLFDVFGSWWFVLITVLLFVSLGGVPDPADACADPRAACPAGAGARDRCLPSLRRAHGRSAALEGARRVGPRVAPAVLPGGARSGATGAGRREGRAA